MIFEKIKPHDGDEQTGFLIDAPLQSDLDCVCLVSGVSF